MSIATAIQNAQLKVVNAYSAVNEKGGTLPEVQNLNNLPDAIISIPAGGGDEIDALNLTGATLSDGDKVWLDSQIVEQSSTGSKKMTYSNYAYTFMTTDGNYLLSGTQCFNFSTQQITVISRIPTPYDGDNYPIYADDGLVFLDGTMVNTPSPYDPGYGRALGGNFFFSRNDTSCEIRKIDLSTGTVLATYAFTISYTYNVVIKSLVIDNILYFMVFDFNDSPTNETIKKALNGTDLTEVTDTKDVLSVFSTNSTGTKRQALYVTSDKEFILRFSNSEYSYSFTLFRQNSSGIYTAIANINDVCPDMAPYYNKYGYFTFNPISGVVVFNTTQNSIAAFQYQSETKTFVKLDVSITDGNVFIYCDNEGKTLGWLDNSYNGRYIKLAKNEDGFAVIPYNTTYLRSSAFTGYVTEGGASNEVVKVATTMPEKLNVSVTVNANDAEISGGIE